jgi:hypothetical protein
MADLSKLTVDPDLQIEEFMRSYNDYPITDQQSLRLPTSLQLQLRTEWREQNELKLRTKAQQAQLQAEMQQQIELRKQDKWAKHVKWLASPECQEQTKRDRKARLKESADNLKLHAELVRQTELRIQELQELSSQLMPVTESLWRKADFRPFELVRNRFPKNWKATLNRVFSVFYSHIDVKNMFLALIVAVTLPDIGLPEIPKGTELLKLPSQTCPFVYRINILIPGRPVYRFKYDVRFDEISPYYSS